MKSVLPLRKSTNGTYMRHEITKRPLFIHVNLGHEMHHRSTRNANIKTKHRGIMHIVYTSAGSAKHS